MTTIHSYTATQKTVDGVSAKDCCLCLLLWAIFSAKYLQNCHSEYGNLLIITSLIFERSWHSPRVSETCHLYPFVHSDASIVCVFILARTGEEAVLLPATSSLVLPEPPRLWVKCCLPPRASWPAWPSVPWPGKEGGETPTTVTDLRPDGGLMCSDFWLCGAWEPRCANSWCLRRWLDLHCGEGHLHRGDWRLVQEGEATAQKTVDFN